MPKQNSFSNLLELSFIKQKKKICDIWIIQN